MAKFKSGFYVMEMWQTGNVGARNIAAVKGQPEEGFKNYDTALAWMIDEYGKSYTHSSFTTYTIMEVYKPIK